MGLYDSRIFVEVNIANFYMDSDHDLCIRSTCNIAQEDKQTYVLGNLVETTYTTNMLSIVRHTIELLEGLGWKRSIRQPCLRGPSIERSRTVSLIAALLAST